MADGSAEPVPVDLSRAGAAAFEDWYRHVETNEAWSLFHPDPPSSGSFDRVADHSDPSDSK